MSRCGDLTILNAFTSKEPLLPGQPQSDAPLLKEWDSAGNLLPPLTHFK